MDIFVDFSHAPTEERPKEKIQKDSQEKGMSALKFSVPFSDSKIDKICALKTQDSI